MTALTSGYFKNDDVMTYIISTLNINWINYLNLSYLLFLIGISSIVFNYKNFLVTMLSIELMYLGIVSAFTIISVFTFDITGQIYALTILILAASESAVGLGMVIVLFRYGHNIDFNSYNELRG